MPFNRRFFLKALSLFAATPLVAACDDDDSGETDGTETGPGTDTDTGATTTDAGTDTGTDTGTDGATTGETTGTGDTGDTFPDYEWSGEPGPEGLFAHGVASGDPYPDSVILWTRVSPAAPGAAAISVWWEIARDEAFESRVAVGTVETSADRDFTVKVEAGPLTPGTRYFYRFFAQGRGSPVGKTRSAPAGATEKVRLGLCSCSNYAAGYFHAYAELAKVEDLDAVLHVGDYIYEYGEGEVRTLEPATEIVTLADYRQRYSYYRLDKDLQAAHAAHPFIAVWDDHETTNNSWRDGAQNHQPESEGDWQARKLAAYTAYAEWMPIREQAPFKLWRGFEFGDRVSVSMLDTRIWGRDAEKNQGGDPADPNRQILGADQEAWLVDRLAATKGQWTVMGQQVPFSPLEDTSDKGWESDKWDEYDPARQRVYKAIRDNKLSDVVVFTGDVHASWALDVAPEPYDTAKYNPENGEGSLAVEIVAPAICQGGLDGLIAQSTGEQRVKKNPHVQYQNAGAKGFVVTEFTADRMRAEWWFVSGVVKPEYTFKLWGAVTTLAGTNHLVREDIPVGL
jgi:alkaline phosphatase D